jgi:AraC-like DNA-binding protein
MDDQNEFEATTELDPTDNRICDLLAEGWTHARIAEEVGVSAKTIQRRLQVPEFSSELRRRRRAVVAATTAGLENMGVAALTALRELLGSDDDRVRLRSVELVLQVGRRYHQEDLIEQQVLARLEAVESKAGIGEGTPGGEL